MLEEIYDMKEFEPKFNAFVKETEFGTSAYYICYEKGLVNRDIQDHIIKMRYDHEKDLQTFAYNHIPPQHMKELRELVEKHLPLVDVIFKDEKEDM